jgi:IclR family transcriptional regulator, pca regulon regulatory protein
VARAAHTSLGYLRSRDGAQALTPGAMNVTVHAAETSRETLLYEHLPHLLRAADDVSGEWALWQARPHAEHRPADRDLSATGG